MKSLFLFITCLFTTAVNAQSAYTSTIMDNQDDQSTQLLTLPWDQSQLVQVKRVYVQGTNSSSYFLEEISTGVVNTLSIPLCSAIKSKPTVLDDGILFSGESMSDGNECMFFDGVNTTVFDLNAGAGSSNPVVYVLQGRVFLIASTVNGNQLFEFDKVAHTVTQLTFGSPSVFRVCAVWNDAIYYSTRNLNSANSEHEYTLMKATLGSIPSYTAIRSILVPNNPIRLVLWNSPQIKWGKLYLTEDISNLFITSDLSVISIDQSNQITTVHEDLQSDGRITQLFEWDDALWTYASTGSASQLYKSTDGISFVADANSGTKKFKIHHLSENNKVYFILKDFAAASQEAAVYNGSFQTVFTGDDLDFLLEEDDVLYLSNEKSSASSSIVLSYTNYDFAEEIDIDQGSFLGLANVSTIFENEFAFLFKYGPQDIDVLKVTGSPQAGVSILSNDLQVYPNPVESGEALFLNSEVGGEYQIYSSDNRLVGQGEFHHGLNQLEMDYLSTGMYFFSFQGTLHQVLVK